MTAIAYVTGLQPTNRMQVVLPNGTSCSVQFDYKPVTRDIPLIGPLAMPMKPRRHAGWDRSGILVIATLLAALAAAPAYAAAPSVAASPSPR